MLGLGTLAKLAKGGIGPDEFGEMLAAMGMNGEMAQVQDPRQAIRELAVGASLPSRRMLSIHGTMRDGETLQALLIVGK